MIKSLIAIAIGLIVITIYNNKDYLTDDNQSLFSLSSSVNHDLSLDSLGDTFATIDWANPIQITKNGDPTPPMDNDDSIAKTDEIQINADSSLAEQQIEQIAEINLQNETGDNSQIKIENENLALSELIEIEEQTQFIPTPDSIPLLAQPTEIKENSNDTKDETWQANIALIKNTLEEQTQSFNQKLEKQFLLLNKSQQEINSRLSILESDMSNFGQMHLNLIKDIDQFKNTLEKIENSQINEQNNKTIDSPQKQNSTQDEPQTENTNEKIESIVETITATRKLLESLEIDTKQQNQNPTENTIPTATSPNNNLDQASVIKQSEEEKSITTITNDDTTEVNNDDQKIKVFAKGMLDRATDLAKNSKMQKAYEIMKQIEPVLSEDLDYLLKMAEINKQMAENELALAYYKKAAVLATLKGDYGVFQEVIGNVMDLDMLTAGELINQYSSRFEQ